MFSLKWSKEIIWETFIILYVIHTPRIAIGCICAAVVIHIIIVIVVVGLSEPQRVSSHCILTNKFFHITQEHRTHIRWWGTQKCLQTLMKIIVIRIAIPIVVVLLEWTLTTTARCGTWVEIKIQSWRNISSVKEWWTEQSSAC